MLLLLLCGWLFRLFVSDSFEFFVSQSDSLEDTFELRLSLLVLELELIGPVLLLPLSK